jgi:hypothetical protein
MRLGGRGLAFVVRRQKAGLPVLFTGDAGSDWRRSGVVGGTGSIAT